MNELALFAGAGGGILGGHLLGWRTRCAVEFDSYARRILLARQRDGMLPRFPIWDDVQTFDGKPWRGKIDVVSGGFPCQDISIAGKGAGIEGGSSGLWSHMARIVGEVRPRFVFVENSPLLVQRGLAVVISDLAALGYDARWGVLGAHHVSAPHKRERLWLVAYPMQQGEEGAGRGGGDRWRQESEGLSRQDCGHRDEEETLQWVSESGLERVVSPRLAHALDRHHAIGNGQVPRVAAAAWRILTHNVELSGNERSDENYEI